MRSVTRSVFVVCAGLLFATAVRAQPAQQELISFTAVDRVFQINGVYRPTDGKAAAAAESVTFSIYAEATGGTPIWQETQSVTVDSQGRYSALLGVTTDGLPVDLFASAEPRWLGLQFLRKGEAELPRTLRDERAVRDQGREGVRRGHVGWTAGVGLLEKRWRQRQRRGCRSESNRRPAQCRHDRPDRKVRDRHRAR